MSAETFAVPFPLNEKEVCVRRVPLDEQNLTSSAHGRWVEDGEFRYLVEPDWVQQPEA